MTSSSSSSSPHNIKTCKCQFCEIKKLNIRREKDLIRKRNSRQTDCKNPTEDCNCAFHVKYRVIKDKDALAHSNRRQLLTPEEKSKTLVAYKQYKIVTKVLLSPEQKEIILKTRATDSYENLLLEYENAVKTVFNRQELEELDRNFDFCKYAGKYTV